MKARHEDQPIESALGGLSRRTILKRSLALGGVALTANGTFTKSVLSQDQAKAVSAPTPIEATVLAEWTVTNPSGVYVGFDSIWVPGNYDLTTTRIDPATNEVVAVIEGTGWYSSEALEVGDVLWVTGQYNDTTWIDPRTNTTSTTMAPVPGGLIDMAYGFDSLWITSYDSSLSRIDPATGEILAVIPYATGNADINGFVNTGPSAVWVEHPDELELIKIDPASNSVVSRTPNATLLAQAKAQTTLPSGAGTDSLWLMDGYEGLLRLDPVTGVGLSFLPLTADQRFCVFISVTDEHVWLGSHEGELNRVNVATSQIDATYDTGQGAIWKIATGFGSVWVDKYDRSLIQRLDIAP